MKKIFSPWRSKYIESFSEEEDKSDKTFIQLAIESKNDKESLVVERRELCFVLMNKYPYNNGHLLIAPYRQVSDIDELEEDEYNNINKALMDSIKVIKSVYSPHGYNVGVNIGDAGGAGLPQHLHYHIVPRWNGDTNFISTVADIKLVSVSMEESWQKLKDAFLKIKGK
ncbi:HIT domain-containing protein [Candidatus Kapabacteria bacterium]|nr:HIT domain-containing protein [Candidatus Kapabacteria bacterium]